MISVLDLGLFVGHRVFYKYPSGKHVFFVCIGRASGLIWPLVKVEEQTFTTPCVLFLASWITSKSKTSVHIERWRKQECQGGKCRRRSTVLGEQGHHLILIQTVASVPQNQIQRPRRLQIRPIPFRSHQLYQQIRMHTELMAVVQQMSVKPRRIRRDHLSGTTGLGRHLYSCLGLQQFKTGNGRSGIRKRTKLSATVVRKFNSLVYDCIIKDGRSFGDLRKPGLARLLSEMLPGKEKSCLGTSVVGSEPKRRLR